MKNSFFVSIFALVAILFTGCDPSEESKSKLISTGGILNIGPQYARLCVVTNIPLQPSLFRVVGKDSYGLPRAAYSTKLYDIGSWISVKYIRATDYPGGSETTTESQKVLFVEEEK